MFEKRRRLVDLFSFWNPTIESNIKGQVIVIMVVLISMALVITLMCEYSEELCSCCRRLKRNRRKEKRYI